MGARTLRTLLRERAASTPASIAYIELDAEGRRRSVSWGEFLARVERLANSLSALGLKPGDRVAILGPNSIDWETAQHASLACGGLVAGVDPHYPPDQLNEVVKRLRPNVVFAHDTSYLERLGEAHGPALRFASVFRSDPKVKSAQPLHIDDLLGSSSRKTFDWARASMDAGGVITFSSGTTGAPKPIAFTHNQIHEAIRAIVGAFPDIGPGDRLLCWLPLANLFQRMINFCAAAVGAASYLADDPRAVMNHLSLVKPRVFIGVPRFFERVHAGVADKLRHTSWPMRSLAKWGISHGHRHALASRPGAAVKLSDRLAMSLADRIVLSRIRRVFGGHAEYLVSGSAPMPHWLLEWFDAVGLAVYEAYGVSENIVPVAINRPGQHRLGTVGRPLPPNEVKLAADGEILVRGPGLFKGYMLEEQGALRPSADGFWATGDLGSLDPDGYLSIHGRKSDTFKTSTGRWISPTRVEDCLRRLPYVQHAVVTGMNRKAPVAILCLNPRDLEESTAERTPPTCRIDARDAVTKGGEANLASDLERVLQGVAPHERPAGVLIVSTEFSIGGGELTTNLKLRRAEVERKYGAEIETLYRRLDLLSSRAEPSSHGLVVQTA